MSALPKNPLSIRTSGIELQPDLKLYVRARLARSLGKFAPRIERLTARFKDVNGPRGGVDTICRVKVVLLGLPTTVVETRAATARAAFAAAATSVTRAVRKTLSRGVSRVEAKRTALPPRRRTGRPATRGGRGA